MSGFGFHRGRRWLTISIPLHPIDIAKALLVVLVAAYIVVVVIHLGNGLGFGAALSGGFIDARVAVNCPQKPKLLWDFINRSPGFDYGMRLGAQWGGSYGELCELDSIDDLTVQGSENQQSQTSLKNR